MKNYINHLSIILDETRDGLKNNIQIIDAYSAGIDNVLKISENLIEKKIKYLSVFTLSTENLKENQSISFLILYMKNFQNF